jgi:hypothetical protein
MENESGQASKPPFKSAFDILEKIQELRWVMQLGCAVLFADILMIWRTGSGIKNWSASTESLLNNAGQLVIGTLGYGLLTTFILPIISSILVALLWQIVFSFPAIGSLISESTPSIREGFLRSGTLKKHALEKKDSFLLDIFNNHAAQKKRELKETNAFAAIVFAALTLALANYYFDANGQSLTSEFLKEFGNWANACFAIGSFFALGILKHSWLTSNNQSDWIYYPSLAEELHPKSKLQAPSHPQTIRNFEQ